MSIGKNKVVQFDYTLTNAEGQVLDTTSDRKPLAYIHGNGFIIPGLEEAMEGKNIEEKFTVNIPPEKAYGPRDDALIQAVPREQFDIAGGEIQAGMQFQAQGPGGVQVITVVKVEDQMVTVDANHPLAGQTLTFDVQVKEIREATEEELQHGHVHLPGAEH